MECEALARVGVGEPIGTVLPQPIKPNTETGTHRANRRLIEEIRADGVVQVIKVKLHEAGCDVARVDKSHEVQRVAPNAKSAHTQIT